jgi:uncharacterized membrane protein YsdA (DUF1294 family)
MLQEAVIYYLITINILTFLLYWIDKRKAIKNKRRISEKRLHTFELLGGTLGAFAAQRLVRHKNKKVSFLIVFYLIVVMQVSVVYLFLHPGLVGL